MSKLYFRELLEGRQVGVLNSSFLFFLNIRSLRCHYDELKIIIDDFEVKPPIIALCETWLTDNDPLSIYSVEGYQPIITTNRKGTRGGGCAFFVRSDLKVSKLQLESDLEFLAISVKNEKHSKNFIVFYRKPSSALNDFFEKLESFLDTVATWKNQTIICGDFNIDSLDASITSENFLTLMNSHGFLQRNFEPTRVTSSSQSCIDYIFTNSCLNKINALKTVISDHYSILLEIDDFKNKNDIKTHSVFRNINPLKNDKNLVGFLFLLHEKLNKMQSSLNADEQITYIVNSLTRILDKFCPLSQVNNKAKPTWITQDIKKQMQKRNMFYKKWIIDPTPTNLEKYKLSRNLTTSLIRNSKLKFYQQKIEKSKNNKSIF